MSETTFTFRSLQNEAEAAELVNLLLSGGIAAQLESAGGTIDTSFLTTFKVQIDPASATRAENLLIQNNEEAILVLPADYYLYAFSRQELLDVVAQAHEWNALDVMLAEKLLLEQGVVLSEKEVSVLRDEWIDELSRPEKPPTLMITIGYTCSLLGGVLGIIIGRNLMYHKKNLPNGKKIYAYSDLHRHHGKNIAIIGTTISTFIIFMRIIWIVSKQ